MTTQPEIRRSVAAWAAETLEDDLAQGAGMDMALNVSPELLCPSDANELAATRLAVRCEAEYRRLIAELRRRAEKPLPVRKER